MKEINKIIGIIDLLLVRNEILTGQSRPAIKVSTKEFFINGNTKYEVIKILEKLCEIGGATLILSLNDLSEWQTLISEDQNNILDIRIDELKLVEYKDKLEKKYLHKKNNERIIVVVSEEQGIYVQGNEDKKYPIRGFKRINIIKSLKSGKKSGAELNSLIGNEGKDFPKLNKEIRNINKLFRENLSLSDDLILSLNTGGYKLNSDKFNIIFK